MSRLTRRFDGKVKMVGCAYDCKRCDGMDCTYPAIAIDKLAHYEDLEEQGRLIDLPCKVGDTVWSIDKTIVPYTVAGFLHNGSYWKVRLVKIIPSWVGNQTEHKYVAFSSFGKTVFTTKEEAEAKLAELKGAEE